RLQPVQRGAVCIDARDPRDQLPARQGGAKQPGRAVFGEVMTMAMGTFINADPYPWPYNGDLRPDNTALIVIDMQTDFCGVGGYVDKMGYDLSLTRAPIEPIKRLLAVMRAQGFHIIHTREGHRPDVTDLPANKHWLSG